jgi:hypothetical protein
MIQIFTNGTFLDVPEDLNIPINRSVADIREPENRQSDWTKTFTLAGTKINKEYFSHLYHINYEITAGTQFSPDFNPNYRAPAELWEDNIPQLKGFLRLIQINVLNDEHIEFECSMHGITAELFTQVRGLKMSDLNFNEYNHTFNTTNVVTSWSNIIQVNGSPTTGGQGIGYLYGLVNNGQLNSYNNVTLNFYKPFLYAKTVIDKILANAGFEYTAGSFFNDATFKSLIMSSDVGTPPTVPYLFNASASVDTSVLIGAVLPFDTETDPNGIYNLATDAIVMGTKSAGYCDLVLEGNVKMTGLTANETYDISWLLKQNGTPVHLGTSVATADAVGAVNDGVFITFDNKYLGYGTTYTVEVLDIFPRTLTSVFPTGLTLAAGFQFYNVKKRGATPTQTMQFDQFFTGDIKQEEVLKSFVSLFNLYIDTDEDGKLVILPYDDYYTGNLKNWSTKLDKDQNLSIIPMGELNAKRFYFSYAQGDDTFNKEYKAIYNRNYGDVYVNIDNDFVKEEKKIELVFKPTQVHTIEGRTYPLIDTFNGIHLLFHNSISTTNPYNIYEDTVIGASSVPSIVQDVYPLTIHTDTNINPSIDILFGTPFEAGYPQNVTYTSNNSYNAYWSRYINEITDPNSKVVTGYFHITPADFATISFRDIYFFENSYFRLNKIVDYVPNNLTLCEFVQLQTYPNFTPSSGDIGQSDWAELMGNKIVKIGEAQFFGDKDMIVGHRGGYTSNASLGNFIAGSSGVIVDGKGNVVLMSTNINISGNDKLYWFNKEVDLTSPATGDSIKYDGTKWVADVSAGSGDMTKAEYDTDNDGIVDAAETLSGLTATITELNYTDGVSAPIQTQIDGKAATIHTHTIANITNLQTELDGKEPAFADGYGITGTSTKAIALSSASAFVTAETTISAATYADITGASITLAAGTWIIFGHVVARQPNAIIQVFVAITDSANTVIAESAISRPAAGTASLNSPISTSWQAIVSPASSTTYKLRGARGLTTHTGSWVAMDGTGFNTTSHASNNSDKGTSIIAIRIS